jgi:hypothetical protein
MRTVELELGFPIDVPMDKLFNAIGYLSTWSMSYPKVSIYRDNKSPNLMAHYFKENGDCGYTISAIWDGTCEKYSFHS